LLSDPSSSAFDILAEVVWQDLDSLPYKYFQPFFSVAEPFISCSCQEARPVCVT